MKQFKEFKSEQQYISEIGPVAGTIMGVLGLATAGYAGYKGMKKGIKAIKGFRDTRKEKKQNPAGQIIKVPEFNPQTGKVENTKEVKTPSNWPSVSGGGLTNKELKDFKQKFKDKAEADKEAWDIKNPGKAEKIEKEAEKQKQAEKKKEKEKEKAAKDKEDQDKADQELEDEGEDIPIDDYVGVDVNKIPKSKRDEVKGLESKEIKDGKEVVKWMKKWKDHVKATAKKGEEGKINPPSGWSKVGPDGSKYDKKKHGNKFSYKKTDEIIQGETTVKNTSAVDKAKKGLKKSGIKAVAAGRLLKFGEFISEGVMDDLKKASKSRKDSEITLDDGADIPIDPLTSQILVKYIEGLSSSEKNKTIKQIQRTERAFLKVLGKAHEG